MKVCRIIIVFLFTVTCLSVSIQAQWTLALDAYGITGVKRYRFYAQDNVKLKLHTGEVVQGALTLFNDSLFMIEKDVINLNEVKVFYRKRSGWEIGIGLGTYGLILFSGIPAFNALINQETLHDPQIITPTVIWGGAVAGSALMGGWRKKYRIRNRHTLKLIKTH